jgi:hypothetical protein
MFWSKRGNTGKLDPKGEIVESVEDKTGKTLVQIEKHGRNVSIKIRSRVDGEVLFDCNYETDANERASYYDAEQLAESYLRANGLYEDKRLTNMDVGYVRNSTKRMR